MVTEDGEGNTHFCWLKSLWFFYSRENLGHSVHNIYIIDTAILPSLEVTCYGLSSAAV